MESEGGAVKTAVQVMNEPGRDNRSKSYMWVFRGGQPETPALVYQYHSTRSGEVVRSYLSGYKGYVQADGYSGYDGFEDNPDVVLVVCWAHARRKFVEVVDARLRPDNNLAENAIRPFVVGRKNWLFSGHPRGAKASAALYSLIETAKANKLEPYHYLRFIFEKLPFARTEDDYKNLLPQYLNREALALVD